ncbi:MAG: helix-turn-helix domain-containing protein [Deltaproteobacteria bacterium]|nr:helix-turn-helix domain-containing protein [Deltaproteobacteria bacterium]
MNVSVTENDLLLSLGKRLRAERKKRKVSAQAMAESIQVSRLTLERMEKGRPTVAVGVFIKALSALGLTCQVASTFEASVDRAKADLVVPAQIRLQDYPELKLLAWHAKGAEHLKPGEVFEIYDRNMRHLNAANLSQKEKNLIKALYLAFEGILKNV